MRLRVGCKSSQEAALLHSTKPSPAVISLNMGSSSRHGAIIAQCVQELRKLMDHFAGANHQTRMYATWGH